MSLKHKSSLLFGVSLLGTFGLLSLLTATLQAQTIKIGGTGAALGTMQALAEAFNKSRPEAKITVLPSLGSGGARKALLGGAIDIAVTSKAGKDIEKLEGAVAVLLGMTPFVFATSKRNPAIALTTQELVDIWNGRIAAWPDGSRLRLVLRPESDSDTDTLKRISPALEQAIKKALSREGMKIAITDVESADAVEAIKGALGMSTLALLISEKRALKVLSLNGVMPSPKTIADGSYPCFKSIYVITGAKPTELTQKFAAFLGSASGRDLSRTWVIGWGKRAPEIMQIADSKLARTVSASAGAVAIVFAMVMPLGYFSISYQYQVGMLDAQVRDQCPYRLSGNQHQSRTVALYG